MIRFTVATSLAALLAAPALAGDVRPPKGADVGGGASGGGLTLPGGSSNVSGPDIRTTMEEKRKQDPDEAVSKDKVQELRDLAVEEFGQSSSTKDEGQ